MRANQILTLDPIRTLPCSERLSAATPLDAAEKFTAAIGCAAGGQRRDFWRAIRQEIMGPW